MLTAFVYFMYSCSFRSFICFSPSHVHVHAHRHTHTVTFLPFLTLPKNEHHHVHISKCHALPCECFPALDKNKWFTLKSQTLFSHTQATHDHLMPQCRRTYSNPSLAPPCFWQDNSAKIKYRNETMSEVCDWKLLLLLLTPQDSICSQMIHSCLSVFTCNTHQRAGRHLSWAAWARALVHSWPWLFSLLLIILS